MMEKTLVMMEVDKELLDKAKRKWLKKIAKILEIDENKLKYDDDEIVRAVLILYVEGRF
ncbi:hypothetical protein ACPB8Q_05125 [Methanocaldococcus indicus]|uniref:hypothetical protein n=1 Tax=Methanocaldococcus indicus TaxID=213231 RepID=UPI003C6DA4F8